MNDETEEAKIVEVEEPVTIDESQPAIVDVTGNEAEADGEPVSQGLSEEELRDFVRGRLAKHEVPKAIEFVGSLPMTTTGKIMRRELREREKQK